MKRGTYFVTTFLSAAICFGSLMFFVGPQRSGWNHYEHGWHHRHHHYSDEHYHQQPNNDSFYHY